MTLGGCSVSRTASAGKAGKHRQKRCHLRPDPAADYLRVGLPGFVHHRRVYGSRRTPRRAPRRRRPIGLQPRTTSAAPAPEASRQPGKYAWSFQKKPGAVYRPGAMNAGHNMKAPYRTASMTVTATATIHPPA